MKVVTWTCLTVCGSARTASDQLQGTGLPGSWNPAPLPRFPPHPRPKKANMIMSKMPTRCEMNDAIKILKSRGFEHTATLMSPRKDTWDREYGLRFLRGDGTRFWLNYQTIGQLPE